MIWNLYLKDNKVFENLWCIPYAHKYAWKKRDMEEIKKKTQKPYMMYASMGGWLKWPLCCFMLCFGSMFCREILAAYKDQPNNCGGSLFNKNCSICLSTTSIDKKGKTRIIINKLRLSWVQLRSHLVDFNWWLVNNYICITTRKMPESNFFSQTLLSEVRMCVDERIMRL